MNGRNSIVVSRPNSNALTWSTVAAISGSASWVIAVPKTEIVSAVHSFRKSGWCSRLRRGLGHPTLECRFGPAGRARAGRHAGHAGE